MGRWRERASVLEWRYSWVCLRAQIAHRGGGRKGGKFEWRFLCTKVTIPGERGRGRKEICRIMASFVTNVHMTCVSWRLLLLFLSCSSNFISFILSNFSPSSFFPFVFSIFFVSWWAHNEKWAISSRRKEKDKEEEEEEEESGFRKCQQIGPSSSILLLLLISHLPVSPPPMV